MTDAQISQQLREEYAKLKVLAGRVREWVGRPMGDGAWLAEYRKTFEHFRAHLHKQLALEEAGDFLPHVVARRPTLSREVDHLREEHREILSMADEMYTELNQLQPGNTAGWEDCRLRLRHLLSAIDHHGRTENNLVVSVFGIDIGAGD
ncbi:MAG: hemerythrin domain-containing protein [Phycisphaerae bacterium]|nr:hemerythrin domain-containing protein [Phycisphaerae bacterium]NUQ44982.1 hemerythrin domain-containing protein [Phycisphaerae bacterium]